MKIVKTGDRYVIINEETGEIIDDAQSYGYKTFEKAQKAMWYKFKGGKAKISTDKNEAIKFFKENPEIKKRLDNLYEMWGKEIMLGEVTDFDILLEIRNEFNIDVSKNYLKYL